MVQRRNISYATQTPQGTKAWDIFMSLVDTIRTFCFSFKESSFLMKLYLLLLRPYNILSPSGLFSRTIPLSIFPTLPKYCLAT